MFSTEDLPTTWSKLPRFFPIYWNTFLIDVSASALNTYSLFLTYPPQWSFEHKLHSCHTLLLKSLQWITIPFRVQATSLHYPHHLSPTPFWLHLSGTLLILVHTEVVLLKKKIKTNHALPQGFWPCCSLSLEILLKACLDLIDLYLRINFSIRLSQTILLKLKFLTLLMPFICFILFHGLLQYENGHGCVHTHTFTHTHTHTDFWILHLFIFYLHSPLGPKCHECTDLSLFLQAYLEHPGR